MIHTLQETNISPKSGILKMIFLFPRWDMLIPWRVYDYMMDMDESISSWYFRLGPGSAHPIPYAAPTSRRIQELVENYNAFLEQVDEHTQCPPQKLGGGFNVFSIFTPIWGRFPIWPIFFKEVETTNQKSMLSLRFRVLNQLMVWSIYYSCVTTPCIRVSQESKTPGPKPPMNH